MSCTLWPNGTQQIKKQIIPDGLLERDFGLRPAASRKMRESLDLWYQLYINRPPWESECVRPLGLPGAIGRELARSVLTEFSAAFSGGARDTYLNEQFQLAAKSFSKYLEQGLCLGGIALKPFQDNGRILVEGSCASFVPTQFDGAGKCVGGVFKSAPIRQGRDWFVRLEVHSFQPGSLYTVENCAYKSSEDGHIGARASLAAVKAWADLEPVVWIEGLTGPLFACFKPPRANNLEPDSPLGVSVYAGEVTDLLRQADEQWERLRWEYESGERKIFSDATQVDERKISDRLFLKGMFTSEGNLFSEFSPAFRNAELYEGFQYTLKIIEFCTGLAFGTISDPQTVEKTATEQIMTRHRQHLTVKDIQTAFQETLDGLLYAMDALCSLNRLAPEGGYQVTYNWGDGVLDDPDTRRQNMSMDLQLVRENLMSRTAFVMKWEKVDEAEAKRRLAEIDADTGEDPPMEEEE